jgi:3-polyprenyl-4-hydroxybenzoate decarboxylase
VVNADLEAAAITRRSTEQRKPAPLFERIAGFGAEFRMVGAPGALSGIPGHPLARVSLSVGLPHTTTAAELVEHLRQAGHRTPVPPRLVSAGKAETDDRERRSR